MFINKYFITRQRYLINISCHNVMFNNAPKTSNYKKINFLTYSAIRWYGKKAADKKSSTKNSKSRDMVDKLAEKLPLNVQIRSILEKHPKKLARHFLFPEGLAILDKEVAKNISNIIMKELAEPPKFLFEVNPGPGVMTEVFLENTNINTLRVFEKRNQFIPYLETLKLKYNKLEIVTEDFLRLPSIYRRDMFSGEDTVDFLFKGVNPIPWIKSSPLQIFAIMPNKRRERNFLNYILQSYMFLGNIFSFGRTQLFVFVSEKEFKYMTATPDSSWLMYRNISILYQTFFDIKLLHSEPRTSFFPPSSETQSLKALFSKDSMYLMMLTPKATLLEILPPHRLPEFGFFVWHHFTKRRCEVIPSLEKWIPNSSVYFLKQDLGLDKNTQFGELTSSQVLKLFLKFSSMKKYSSSSFKIAAKTSMSFHSREHCCDENKDDEYDFIDFKELLVK